MSEFEMANLGPDHPQAWIDPSNILVPSAVSVVALLDSHETTSPRPGVLISVSGPTYTDMTGPEHRGDLLVSLTTAGAIIAGIQYAYRHLDLGPALLAATDRAMATLADFERTTGNTPTARLEAPEGIEHSPDCPEHPDHAHALREAIDRAATNPGERVPITLPGGREATLHTLNTDGGAVTLDRVPAYRGDHFFVAHFGYYVNHHRPDVQRLDDPKNLCFVVTPECFYCHVAVSPESIKTPCPGPATDPEGESPQ